MMPILVIVPSPMMHSCGIWLWNGLALPVYGFPPPWGQP